MTDGLNRFKSAQDSGAHDAAMAELRSGAKRSHWIWFVFPQVLGLGTSEVARRYAIVSFAEAEDYLADALLRERLVEACDAVHEQLVDRGADLVALMGSRTDALKLVSSLTLFERVAGHQFEYLKFSKRLRAILAAAEKQGFPRCAFTLEALGEA